jgi:hypothetical protein
LIGIEDKVWVRVGDQAQVWAIADEDLERTAADKTSSVHFVRFELTPEMVTAAKAGAAIAMGIDHPEYRYETVIVPETRASLTADLS